MTTQTAAPKILVVDDDPQWLRVVSLYLQKYAYQIATAQDGEEAIRKVAEEQPDVVIADINMPGLDGFELCRQLRRDPATRTIPFIFLTGRDQDHDRVKARKIGSDDYLTKPCPLDRLSRSVDTLIDRVQQARNIPMEEIELSGRIEEVDLLDLIQTLELNQKSGALVLSHGERTATLYFKEGVIVDADIRSPKREEPLFILLGWKTGRFLFLPGATPERMPITASLANLLFRDLHALEKHEHELPSDSAPEEPAGRDPASLLLRQVLKRLQEVADSTGVRYASAQSIVPLRVLVAGVKRSGKSELIHDLLRDLAQSRWAAVGVEQPASRYKTDVGRVRLSNRTALHLVAVRAEKRFWPLWEQCLPMAVGIILLVDPRSSETMAHVQAFLETRAALAQQVPVQVLVPEGQVLTELPGLPATAITSGSPQDRLVRLTLLDALLRQRLELG